MALKLTKESKFIKGKLVNGEVYDELTNDNIIPYGRYEGHEEFKEIIIPDGIIKIVSEAFMDCSSLTTITLPDSLQRIDFNAFVGCTAFQKVVLPASLSKVEFWLDGRGVSKITLSSPSSDILIKNLQQGYAMDLYYIGEYREEHWD